MTEIALHFAANLISCWIIVRMIYQSKAKRRDFVFTFTMVSASVFLLCRMLSGVELDLAFALGLFAIFGIIRYRTNPVPIREMTYLFLVIAMAVMNALGDVHGPAGCGHGQWAPLGHRLHSRAVALRGAPRDQAGGVRPLNSFRKVAGRN